LLFVVTRSALAAWAVAIHGGFGTRRIPELAGWARRAPLLAVALALIAVAGIGWPGLAVWDARFSIANLALPRPLAALVAVAPVAALVIYGRVLIVGVARPGEAVAEGRGERPRWPVERASRELVGQSRAERSVERVERLSGATLDVIWTLPTAARANRMPIAAVVVLVLAGLSAALAGGTLGVAAAARAVPATVEPGPSQPAPAPETSPVPSAGQSSGASTQRSTSRV
jgi:formate hydrogenlyase subunit 3/multisubunit Na+/H+ antiporter MnhD subunit